MKDSQQLLTAAVHKSTSIPVKVLAFGLDIIKAVASFTLALAASSFFLAGPHIERRLSNLSAL